jgi:hypothetical protein
MLEVKLAMNLTLTPSLPLGGGEVSAGRVRGISTKFFRFISLILNVN